MLIIASMLYVTTFMHLMNDCICCIIGDPGLCFSVLLQCLQIDVCYSGEAFGLLLHAAIHAVERSCGC